MGRPADLGIGGGSELIEIAGGIDIFADRRNHGEAKDRIVRMEDVVKREPDLIIGSWCGKKFRPERVALRPGFAQIPAVQYQDLHEIKSSLILQPGPAALTDGLAELQELSSGGPFAAETGAAWTSMSGHSPSPKLDAGSP